MQAQSVCGICEGQDFHPLFRKKSEKGESFTICRCRRCGTVQTLPRPSAAELAACYQGEYFERRTDRGYSSYTSDAVRHQVERVFTLNLQDLGFFDWERDLMDERMMMPPVGASTVAPMVAPAGGLRAASPSVRPLRSLDVGCAAGYFVRYMGVRGWQSEGIEVSAPMARFARTELHLAVREGDFLAESQASIEPYDLVTLWASLEHFPDPRRLADRLGQAVRSDGRLILSTCRWGLLSRLQGPYWRYMNVPEHLFFFSLPGIRRFFSEYGFECVSAISYGSGLTARPAAGRLYALTKALCDPLVKWTNQGDMMALHFRRR